ncbi:MAG: hypothetical protein ACJ780_31590 [Solirubrobacteraceae bacterium]
MATIRLTEANAQEGHPDYQALCDWLQAHGADVAWVRVPQDLEVTNTELVITEYVHDTQGGLVYDRAMKDVRTRQAHYPRRRRPLPKLTSTEVL